MYNTIKNSLSSCQDIDIEADMFASVKFKRDQKLSAGVHFGVANGVTTVMKSFDKEDITSLIKAMADNTDSEGGMSPGATIAAIVGGVIGLVVIVIIGVAVYYYMKKKGMIGNKKVVPVGEEGTSIASKVVDAAKQKLTPKRFFDAVLGK